jgi:tetratricopeptide (TPR) repeat protein
LAIRRWNIHTVVALVSRAHGTDAIPWKAFCDSPVFRLAYLDESMAVFTLPEDLRTPPLDCQTVQIAPPSATASAWARYNTYTVAGRIYYTMGRLDEADRAWRQAAAVFADGPEVHLNLGHLRQSQGRLGEAEREFRMAVQELPISSTFAVLSNLLAAEGRAPEAIECLRASAARNQQPFLQWLAIGRNELVAGQPQEALDALNRAARLNPYQGAAAPQGLAYMVELWALKGKALLALGRPQEAITAFETSWQMAPGMGQPADFQAKWAEAYRMAGRPADAERVLREARRGQISQSPLR